MDCFKSSPRSPAVSNVGANTCASAKGGGSRKSCKPLAKQSSGERQQQVENQRQQFDLPYDPIDLDDGSLPDADAGDGRPIQRQPDWWETLFPARFTMDSSADDDGGDGDASLAGFSERERLAREDPMVPPPARSRRAAAGSGNAYRRVWERLQREEAEAAAAASAAVRASSDTSETPPLSQSRRRRSPREAAGGVGDCVWTSDELRLFRRELDKLRQENNLLKAAVRFQAERLESLEIKCRAQTRQLQSKGGAASEAAKANERYRILAEGLQSRALEAERRCEELRSALAQAGAEGERTREEAHAVGERLQRANAKLERARQREAGQREELAREFALREEQLRVAQAGELRQLEDALADLRTELRKEQYLHRATRLGHQKLLSHFSSSSAGGACSTCGGHSSVAEADIRLF